MRKGRGSVIVIHQRIDPDSRTANRGSAWVAETIVDGVTYLARSRNGAPHEIARQLIAAGIEDQSARVYTAGIKGFMSYKSIAKMATRTIVESAARSVHSEKWSEFVPIGGKNGGKPYSGVGGPIDPQEIEERGPLAAKAAE
jgi:hypothetical protein